MDENFYRPNYRGCFRLNSGRQSSFCETFWGYLFKSTQHGSISLSLLLYGLGIASISDMKKLGRIGLRSLGLYLATTSVAIGIGLAFALFFSPGKGCDLQGFNAVDLASSGSSGGMNF